MYIISFVVRGSEVMSEQIYRIYNGKEKKLYPTQETQLEIAKYVDRICRDNNIKYTLLFSSLAGAIDVGGFYKNQFIFQIAMFYDEMLALKEILLNTPMKEDYYFIDHTNCDDFDRVGLLIKKRGEVKLPENRKKDEQYYDTGISIIPIFYSGNTENEKKAFEKKAFELCKRIDVRAFVPEKIRLKSKIKYARYWKRVTHRLSTRTENDFESLKELLLKNNKTKTKYVYLPVLYDQDGCVCEATTYTETTEIKFEGHNFITVKNHREWVERFYPKGRTNLLQAPFRIYEAYGLDLLRKQQIILTELLVEIDRICREHDIRYYIGFGTLLGAVRHQGFIPWDDDADVVMLWEDYQKFCAVAEKSLNKEKFFLRMMGTDKNENAVVATLRKNDTKWARLSREKVDTHLGIKVDIFPMFNGCNSNIMLRIQDRMCRFFKTMVWTHLGAREERRILYRIYYLLLARISNEKAYQWFIKIATINKKETNRLIFPYIIGLYYIPDFGITDKRNYGEPVEITFEGFKLMAPKNYNEILLKTYGDDCIKKLPAWEYRRTPHTVIEVLDLGE